MHTNVSADSMLVAISENNGIVTIEAYFGGISSGSERWYIYTYIIVYTGPGQSLLRRVRTGNDFK